MTCCAIMTSPIAKRVPKSHCVASGLFRSGLLGEGLNWKLLEQEGETDLKERKKEVVELWT
jgi:hypothetical protein